MAALEGRKPNYAVDAKLPSVRVTKRLIADLERYMEQKVSEFSPSFPFRDHFQLIIEDAVGKEELHTIGDFPFSEFSDDTKRIMLNYLPKDGTLRISVRFSEKRHESNMRVFYAGRSAREVAQGIHRELTQTIARESVLVSYVVSPSPKFALLYFLSIVFATILTAGYLPSPWGDYALIGAIVLGLGWTIVAHQFPYSAFDTKRYSRKFAFSKWIALLVLGFLLTGVFFTAIRQAILGF